MDSRTRVLRAPRVLIGWLIASVLAGALPSLASARGASPYLPLNLSPEIERQIERVLILGDKPVTARPIATATVLDALPAACRIDEVLCKDVRRFLERYRQKLGIAHASIEAAAVDGSAVPVPDPMVEEKRQRIILMGDVPSPANPPTGCNFNTRCPVRFDFCFQDPDPPLIEHSPGHWAACHRVT